MNFVLYVALSRVNKKYGTIYSTIVTDILTTSSTVYIDKYVYLQ